MIARIDRCPFRILPVEDVVRKAEMLQRRLLPLAGLYGRNDPRLRLASLQYEYPLTRLGPRQKAGETRTGFGNLEGGRWQVAALSSMGESTRLTAEPAMPQIRVQLL